MDQIVELRQRLSAMNLDFSHVAMKNNGEMLFRVNDVFVSPYDAETIARGSGTIDETTSPGDPEQQTGPGAIAWMAATQTLAPAAKAIYDVGKDGWEKLRPSAHLRIAVLNSEAARDGHIVTVELANLTRSGIYVESVSVAKIIDPAARLSLKQPTVRFQQIKTVNLEKSITDLPVLLSAMHGENPAGQNFKMFCPPLFHEGERRTYGVAEIVYSKLDEPAPDYASFTFRLR